MRLLLDTHTFLWFIEADPHLSVAATVVIGDPDNVRLLSAASIWEIAIKVHSGKLRMRVPGPLDVLLAQQMEANQIETLPVEFSHAIGVYAMPYARHADGTDHKDPFDRLIVSQSLAGELTLVSADAVLDQYGVTRIW